MTEESQAKVLEKEKYWIQILVISVACIASISDGLLAGWSSPFIVQIINDKENYNISVTQASYFSIIPPIATMSTCILFAYLGDVIGRKNTLLIVAFPQIAAWILKSQAKSVYLFYISRFCAGISFACIFSVMPVYVAEVVSPKIRGFCGSCVTSLSFFGTFIINALGNFFDVPTTSYICLPMPVIFFTLFFFMPESPYYLAMKHKDEATKVTLKKLTGKHNVDREFDVLQHDVERQMLEKGSWAELYTIKSNRKACMIGIFLRTSQNLGGIGVLCMNTQYIFEKAGGLVPSDIATIVFTFCLFFLCSLSGFLVDKFGRRPTFISSMVLSSVALLSLAVYFFVGDNYPGVNLSGLNWFPMATLLLYLIFASFGPGIIPTLMIGELFSTSIKAKAVVVMMIIFGLFLYLANQLFYVLNSYAGLSAPFMLFGCINLFAGIVGYFHLPETKGKTLEEIQQEFRGIKSNQFELR